MNIIPTLPIAAQTFNVSLDGQSCIITIYQKSTGLYLDLTVNNMVIMTGVICLDRHLLVRYSYLGFIGDLIFYDNQGTSDPQYTALGSRWQLAYLSPSDVASLA